MEEEKLKSKNSEENKLDDIVILSKDKAPEKETIEDDDQRNIEAHTKSEAITVNEPTSIKSDGLGLEEEEQEQHSPKTETNIGVAEKADSEEREEMQKSIESIHEIDEDNEESHAIHDEDEDDEAAEESPFEEEELIEDTDHDHDNRDDLPVESDSDDPVVLSSDDDDEDDRSIDDHSPTDEDYDDDYDDNDLMNSVILSSNKTSKGEGNENIIQTTKRKRSDRESTEEREEEEKSGNARLDWRADLKKRCLKKGIALNDTDKSTVTCEDEEDFVLDVDVDMGLESTYDDDRDESDDHLSNPSSIKSKSHEEVVEAVVDLDSSPEKNITKTTSREEKSVLAKKTDIDFKELPTENDKDISQNCQTDCVKSPNNNETKSNSEALDDTIVPTENENNDVPKDELIENSKLPQKSNEETKESNNTNQEKVPKDDEENKSDNKLPDIIEKDENLINDNKSKSEDLKEKVGNEPEPEPKELKSNKRRRSPSPTPNENNDTSNSHNLKDGSNHEGEDIGLPAKKLKAELDTMFPKHNQVLTDYIAKSSNETVDNIQCHINQLLVEIQTLNDMIKANENEWNNMIYLKKLKEEICIRLTRKKQTIQMESRKIGDLSALFNDLESDDTLIANNDKSDKQHRGLQFPQSSTPLHNKNNMADNNQNITDQMSSILEGTDSNSKSFPQSAANMIIQNRANMKSSELAKEKINMQKVHSILVSRNILPKPSTMGPLDAINLASSILSGNPCSQQQESILNSYLTSSGFQHLGEILNGHPGSFSNGNHQPLMVGRQGVFKDVKSIIADYRQQHPESVPRRGRRVKQSVQNPNVQQELKSDANSRPSSNDSSSHSISNTQSSQFTDFLVQLKKMTGQTENKNNNNNQGKFTVTSNAGGICSGSSNSGTYPEVTLHPVAGTTNDQAGSLLHGILTKNPRSKDSSKLSSQFPNNFSPTLAKLLTAPEKMASSGNHNSMEYQNISKVVGNNSEITITPVLNSSGGQHSLIQQHLQPHHFKELLSKAANNDRIKSEHFMNIDDEADDSVDRLVIDEGADGIMQHDEQQNIQNRIASHAIDENDVPFCQGCKKNEAQFVCAGCGNQWYCSRDCQVTAWDDHSEICTATKQIKILKTRDVNYKNDKNSKTQLIYEKGRKKYFIIRRKLR